MSEKMNSKDLRGPFTQPWFLVSAVIVGLILLLVVVYALLPPAGQSANPAPAQPVPTGTAQPSKDSEASICGLPTGDQRLPGLELRSTWELNGKTAVPTDPKEIGPGTASGEARTCFAHNPTGALYAAANFFGANIEQQGDVIVEKLIAKGQMRDKFLTDPMTFSPRDSAFSMQVGGFSIQSYASEEATVVLGGKTSEGAFFSVTVPMKWEEGDWKVVLENFAPLAQIDNLSSFIAWSGV
ncbi:hypothetical protein [Pseudarthrobacter sp. PS3-L1]|uniref:hypothetical protein n=1 Tax=Pseudarthrobacter sp. PS3-L1 TaxID=3046207 RepID=UPI0024B9C60D|nr:hypothetical protein [Pseudarthrobacter sp. PS3-L1]MDJ0322120.1 hypothetical protein [Pseudarthrobacter sp. PS3-L1]